MRARDNPFTTDRVLKVRYRFTDNMTWEALLDRLAAMDYRAAIVGPDGSGKTTLLEDLGPRLRARGFNIINLRLTETNSSFPRGYITTRLAGLAKNTIILFDGGDHMKRLAWMRFNRLARKAGGLVITSHRSGLLPALIEPFPTPALLDEILSQLLRDRAADIRDVSHQLYDKYNGNLRDVIRELYDIFAGRRS